ncbi:YqhG family protein [Jeotgalibacillus soli]|uniref:YqhG n=1 Tax=Jeotgalibacillus soli TaxID=889306 RepID=A0A0C2V5W4_9BACL|nr:YqhG family protein [Jeotgalibacillus soli]KIL44382.1 hypothetical protein KP78_33460 [Jeotgalibacillus soli]
MENQHHWELVHRFLTIKRAEVIKGESHSHIRLTEELDRQFMNRPFYWHYRDAMNQPGEPMSITLVTQPTENTQNPTVIASMLDNTFRQLVEAAHMEAGFFKAFEHVSEQSSKSLNTPLYPWLMIQGVLTIDPPGASLNWCATAISLTTGAMRHDGENLLENLILKPQLPDFHFTVAPVIENDRAIEKILQQFEVQGNKLFTEEINQAKARYKQLSDTIETVENPVWKQELKEYASSLKPKIRLDNPIGGLLYLRAPN